VEIEFYGKDTDFLALKLMQSISKSSTINSLQILSIQDETMINTSIAYDDGFEERYLLSCFMYFSLESSIELEIIDSINFNGKIKEI